MVVFEDGLARKSEYRRFVIKGVDGQNDVASMHEVITRRFRRLLDEQAQRAARSRPTAARCWSTPRPAGRASSPTRRAWSWSTAVRPRSRPPSGRWPSSASSTSRSAAWPSGSRRSGCPSRRTRSSWPLERGALPAPADPRRGPPVRDHPPPLAPLQVDGREPARRRARARRGAPQDAAQALRVAEEAARRRRSRRSPRCRASAHAPRRRSRRRSPSASGKTGNRQRQHRHRRDRGGLARWQPRRRSTTASWSSSPA